MQGSQTLLPHFTDDGLLPPGDYPMSLDQLRASFLVSGTGVGSVTWDAPWREHLAENLGVLARQLWQVGIRTIVVNGSFVEDKDHPNDIDGYFECSLRDLATGRLAQSLNAIDEHKIWTWDPAQRVYDPGSGKAQLPMWCQYRVELYPHVGQPAGINDRYGNQLQFPAAFRARRSTYQQKGVITLLES